MSNEIQIEFLTKPINGSGWRVVVRGRHGSWDEARNLATFDHKRLLVATECAESFYKSYDKVVNEQPGV